MKDEKCILVIGASSDIGMALIRRISMNYTYIIAHYHKSNEAARLLVNELGDKVIPVQADFSKRESVDAMVSKIKQKNLTIDHIVYLAAPKFHIRKFIKENIDEIRMEYLSFTESALTILQEFIVDMAKQKYGKIIFMLSSNVIGYPAKYQSAYTISKYALLGLMKSIAVEYAEKGITSNAVSPDMVDTKFVSDIPEMIVRQNAESNPRKRNLLVDEVTPAFEYLLSDGADSVTGVNLPVTGGVF